MTDTDRGPITRRAFLGTTILGSIGLTGCLEGPEPEEPGDPEPNGDPDNEFDIEPVVDGFDYPWGMAFSQAGLLVTERPGGLWLVDTDAGTRREIEGLPAIDASGQGGLLDVTIDPDYPDPAWIYLTYSAANDAGAATHVGRGRLDPDGDQLTDFEELFVAEPFQSGGGHFGSRAVFGEDGALYVTTGDRQDKTFGEDAPDHVSQVTTNELGATLRLNPDGSIPEDNPFVDDPDYADALYTYGHRNAQGMAIHPETGDIWQSEHGERDGDEINIIEGGGNYGWPITHYGCHYGTTDPLGDQPHEHPDTIDPVYYWECQSGGFPPAGMTFYDGEAFPEWQGDLFVGGLASRSIARFHVDGRDVTLTEHLLGDVEEVLADVEGEGWRIRDLAVGPDDALYVAIDHAGVPLYRLVPA